MIVNSAFSDDEFRSLMDFTLELYKLEDTREVLSLIVRRTAKLIKADRCTLYLYDKRADELYSEFYHGAPVKQIRLPLDNSSIAGYCGAKKQTLNINNVYGNIGKIYKGLTFNKSFDKINKYKTRSILCVPLLDAEDSLIGVISLLNNISSAGFSQKSESLLDTISRHAVVSISRLRRQELATIFSEKEQKRLKGHQKLFVVFFDLVGYTNLSESLGDKKIKQIIQYWEEDHIRLVNEYGGIYVKSGGDEIMSLFGIDPRFIEPIPDLDSLGVKLDKTMTLEKFIHGKQDISNHANLKSFISLYSAWFLKNKDTMDKKTLNKANGFKRSLWAENVIRFMYMAQKKLNRLNNFFFTNKILSQEKSHRIFMKGGTEFGPVIVDFDFYGRIDVIGDVVNVASRVTDQGRKYSIGTSIVEQPLLIGPSINNFLPKKGFVNKTKNYIRLKGKEKHQYIYSIDSIDSMENWAGLPVNSFLAHKKYVSRQINELDKIEQKTLPFNYASYQIETSDKYLVDHSKRVAVNCLHIIDLINEKLKTKKKSSLYDSRSIQPVQKKTIVIVALLHDIGRHSLNDHVKAYIDPTKSIRELSDEEKEVFTRLTSSFGASILESVIELRSFAYYVKCCGLHFNGFYQSQSYTDNPSKKKLPIESRIVTIANAMDSIISDTPFREKLDLKNMVTIFRSDMEKSKEQNQVQKFDPSILSLIIEYYQQILKNGF